MSNLEQEALMLNPEDIEKLSRILAEALANQIAEQPEALQAIFYLEYSEVVIIDVDEITHVVNLDLIASSTLGLLDPLGQLQDWFTNIINSVASWIISGIETFINDYVLPLFDTVASSISSFISDYVLPAFDNLFTSISSWITEYVLPAITGVSEAISDFITNNVLPAISALEAFLSDLLSGTALSITQTLTGVIHGISVAIQSAISGAVTSITSIVNSISQSIMSAISGVVDAVSSTFQSIISAISGVIDTLSSIFNSVAQSIMSAIGGAINAISGVISGIANSIIGAISYIGQSLSGLWDFLVSSFQNMIGMVSAGFQAISNTFMGFVNSILQLPALLSETFRPIGEWIWSALPDWIKTPIENIGKFFTEDLINAVTAFSAGLQEFMSDPAGWFKANIVEPAFDFLSFLGEKASSLINFIIDTLKGVWKAVESAFSGFMKFIANAISGFLKGTYESLGKVGEGFRPIFESAYKPIPKSTGEKISEIFKPLFEKAFKDLGIGTPEYLKIDFVTSQLVWQFSIATALAFSPFWAQIPIRLVSFILYNVGQFVHGLELPIRINLTPLGIGVDKTFNLAKAVGASLSHFSAELKKWVDEVGRGLVYGFSIWATQPITKSLNYLMRNVIPVELPQLNVIREFTRRALAHENYGEIVKLAWYYMALYGYSDYVIDLFFKKAEEYYIEIEDRFGNKRIVPLALVYNLPSASDVARMMVRDIIIKIEDFEKFFLATGMHPHIAKLYYLLHFRYPSPETLWKFTMRGVSGLLWATISREEEKDIERDVKASGGHYPLPPSALNKMDASTCGKLLDAFKKYMKWHDYARFSYIPDFPSDNLIYIDTLADIPTKIDQRWMVKWGLYELLSEKGVSYKSPIQHFVAKIVEDNPASEVKMDLTNFSRTLQATGLHPYWIPVTAVAEAMNALSEERTYLRTGVINLFKEGFISRDTLKSVFAGAFKVSFKVAYFDVSDYTWKTGYVNLPVMYLPAERELLALRADMDRVLDILREIQRDVSQAYQEAIIPDYEKYKERLTQVIENIKDLAPPNVKIEFIEKYYKPYVKALEIYREVYTVRRIRSWTMRWLGWIMYRVATGLVTEKELSSLVNTLAYYSKLTKTELKFFSEVLSVMRGIAAREYLPTPSQLATLSEYLVISSELIDTCLKVKMVPDEWKPLWKQYIRIRPVADDIKSLLSTYRRALLYVTIPKDIEKQIMNYAKLINFGKEELEILNLRVSLEELIQNSREYIPTPYSLATLCEYLPEARKFFNQVMEAKRVPKEWRPLWAKYIDIKPLVDDIKKYLSRAENLYARFMITKEAFQEVLDEVAEYLGYTSKEIEFLMKVTEFERARNAWTELIGTVERLVSLSEYSPTATKYALGKLKAMINSLPLPDQDKQELYKMWEEYIRNRPIKSEARMYITQLINLYIDDLITTADFERELQGMKKWGFSDNEIMFYKAIAALRKARKLRIPITYPEEEQAG